MPAEAAVKIRRKRAREFKTFYFDRLSLARDFASTQARDPDVMVVVLLKHDALNDAYFMDAILK